MTKVRHEKWTNISQCTQQEQKKEKELFRTLMFKINYSQFWHLM